MEIFVGNLSFDATEADVRKLFADFGEVAGVNIIMKKNKPLKSRGFGFIQMPDEEQARAAIAALNGKELMGRPLKVDPARPKTEAEVKRELRPDKQSTAEQRLLEEEQEKPRGNPVFNKPGTYKGGRRTRSYLNRGGLTEMHRGAKPWRKSQDNPKRWLKKKDQPRPWQKSTGERKPWEKAEGESRPWKKAEGKSRPWQRTEGKSRPWKKAEGESRPWKKSEGEFQP
ncbi:MAG: hypothetical protein PHH69_07595, partial [Candidatus Omnitrophica bacterium]|nr:hypothetical protein [Candidatus Omnitrophota bacterium]